MKTVNEIYSIAKGLMFEKPTSTIYDSYLIPNLNRVLQDLFQENNVCRVFNGKHQLAQCPRVENLTDEINYEDEYLDIIPIGLACYFLFDDDMSKYADFRTRYNNYRVLAQKIVSEEELELFAPEVE